MPRDATVEEALQFKTYHAVLAGDRLAIRDILEMIEVWSKALFAKQQTGQNITLRAEYGDPDNAFEALLLLDIVIRDPKRHDHESDLRLVLQPWAMDMARKRLQRSWSRKSNNTGKCNMGEPEAGPLPERASE